MGMIKTYRERAEDFLKNKIPAHIITGADVWFNGYITFVGDEGFTILDRKDGLKQIRFSNINMFTEFIGELSSLPIPEVEENEGKD